jgi:peptide/nickel transport system permease protein
MYEYALRRVLLNIPVVFLVLVLTFLMVQGMPGDAIESRLAGTGLTPDQIEQFREEAGLNRPLHVQFFSWLGDLLTGDLGESLYTGVPVSDELGDRLLPSIEIGLLALLVAVVVAVPLGTISAVKMNTPMDYGARMFAIIGLAIPEFFLAVTVILVASKAFGYFPPIGFTPPHQDPWLNLQQIWLPVMVVGLARAAALSRIMRSSLLEVMRADYIRTARSKGLPERTVIIRHAMRSSLIPFITILGLQLATIVGGLVVVETVFNVPGMGQFIVRSVLTRDFIPLQVTVLFIALSIVTVNLLIDLSYGWLDPRIRYGG